MPPAVPSLTDRQREVLSFVYATIAAHGRRPTYREVMAEFGYRSPNAVFVHFRALGRLGYLAIAPNPGMRRRSVADSYSLLRLPDGSPFLGFRPILEGE